MNAILCINASLGFLYAFAFPLACVGAIKFYDVDAVEMFEQSSHPRSFIKLLCLVLLFDVVYYIFLAFNPIEGVMRDYFRRWIASLFVPG